MNPTLRRALLALALPACGSPALRDTPAPVAETAPPTRLSDTLAGAAPSDLVEPASESAPPAPAPVSPEDAIKRLKEEYKALALKNDCSRGKKDLEGDWRFVGESRTPNYTDHLSIKGTRFVEKLTGNPDGKYLAATLEGDIRCVFKNRVLIQVDKVVPEGAYGNRSGDVYPCDVLSDMDEKVDRMLLICYFEWDLRTAAGMEFEFERIEPAKP